MTTTVRRRLIQMSAGIMLLSAAPLAFASNGVSMNDACAMMDTGTCCAGSGTCVIGSYIEHNAFYQATGKCVY